MQSATFGTSSQFAEMPTVSFGEARVLSTGCTAIGLRSLAAVDQTLNALADLIFRPLLLHYWLHTCAPSACNSAPSVDDELDILAAFAVDHGIVFYDALVQRTRQPAQQGQLVVLASGPRDGRDIVQSGFDAVGRRTILVSDKPGTTSRRKLALNAVVFALNHGTAETLAIAKAPEVDPPVVLEAITDGPLDDEYFQGKATAVLDRDYNTYFSVNNGVKGSQFIVFARIVRPLDSFAFRAH